MQGTLRAGICFPGRCLRLSGGEGARLLSDARCCFFHDDVQCSGHWHIPVSERHGASAALNAATSGRYSVQRIVFFSAVVAACIVFFLILRHPPLIRGLSGDMLYSPGRPDVAVRPVGAFKLVDACRADPTVFSEHEMMARVTAKVWYARYVLPTDTARLIVLFASVDDPWTWTPTPRTPVFSSIREKDVYSAGFEGVAATYVLPPERDPWRDDDEGSPWRGGCLVRRHVYQADLLRFNIIVEYREPLPATPIPIQDDPFRLAAFEMRAHDAFVLLRGKDADFQRPTENLPYPPSEVSRTLLGKNLGSVISDAAYR